MDFGKKWFSKGVWVGTALQPMSSGQQSTLNLLSEVPKFPSPHGWVTLES